MARLRTWPVPGVWVTKETGARRKKKRNVRRPLGKFLQREQQEYGCKMNRKTSAKKIRQDNQKTTAEKQEKGCNLNQTTTTERTRKPPQKQKQLTTHTKKDT